MEMKGKGAGAQGYPPRGLGQRPNSIESARPTKTRNSRKTDVHYRFLLTAQKTSTTARSQAQRRGSFWRAVSRQRRGELRSAAGRRIACPTFADLSLGGFPGLQRLLQGDFGRAEDFQNAGDAVCGVVVAEERLAGARSGGGHQLRLGSERFQQGPERGRIARLAAPAPAQRRA